ncbi:ABC transporter-like protein [Moraxella macacae 0408225]|uniref:ABC transporter-like protein n=1 Tax=Moraxella macacae 0408225 TaxID=1230338 RepID=L2F8E8_9GAMM|nr:ABC transporter ATP-binding protein [Moraxella macacae]ELA09317.1 ABC transporter-like protein [Moraxella macacae 0408225]
MLSIQSLCIIRQDKTLLDDITLSLQKGKIYALIGHNGSGKSTLIKALSGEMTPTHGQIVLSDFNDKAIADLPPKTLAKHIAYLAQKLPDANNFTVAELVMLGRYPYQKWLQKPTAQDYAIVAEAMAVTKITKFAERSVATLSGGERARAWLAMCIAQDTPYLLLDEPLAPLDIVYQVEILRLIQNLASQQGKAIVIIIHDINLAAQFCDEFIALKNGKLCHVGDVASTMNQAVLERIFGIQLHLINHPVSGKQVAVV